MANSYTYRPGPTRPPLQPRPASPQDPLCQPKCCPKCGGIQSFERPRFFCGQLLTDKDLDAAQRYVIEKNRLHNRYLVGSGVVCGLAVRCDPCDGCWVSVEPGYAIDCCGNDIVVCEPAPFNVCEYIDKCLREKPVCEEKIRPRSRCDDVLKTYSLTISYSEEPACPITALIRGNGCQPSRCEPSRTRETFRFDLIEQIPGQEKKPVDDFWSKALACLEKLNRDTAPLVRTWEETRKQLESGSNRVEADKQTLLGVLCRLKDYVLKYSTTGPNARCQVLGELRLIETYFPSPSLQIDQYLFWAGATVLALWVVLWQVVKDCLCDAWLLPCPVCEDAGVILARITMRNNKVYKICNMARTHILSGRALRYWYPQLFEGAKGLEDFCCVRDFVEDCAKWLESFKPGVGRAPEGLAAPPIAHFAEAPATTAAPAPSEASRVSARATKAVRFMGDHLSGSVAQLRSGNILQLIDPKSVAALSALRLPDLSQLLASDVLTVLDVYGLSSSEVVEILKGKNVEVSQKTISSADEAHSPTHLAEMSWTLPPGSKVELLLDPENKVTGIRLAKEEKK